MTERQNNIMRKLVAIAALSTAAAAGVVGLASTASAAAPTGYIKQFATSYTSPSNMSVPVHTGLKAGTEVETLCFREGQPLDGNSYWFLIQKDGNLGYVHRDAIAPPADTRHC